MDYTIHVIVWSDTFDPEPAWMSEKDIEQEITKDCIIVSVGFIVGESPTYLAIAGDRDTRDGEAGRVTCIPKSMIVSHKTIKNKGV